MPTPTISTSRTLTIPTSTRTDTNAVFVATGPTNTKGIEAESNIIIGWGFSLYVNGTLGSAKYQEGPKLSQRRPVGGQHAQERRVDRPAVAHKNWDLGLIDKRVGTLYNDNGTLELPDQRSQALRYPVDQAITINPFTVVNVFVNYTIKNQSWLRGSKIGLAVNNLADSHNVVGITPVHRRDHDRRFRAEPRRSVEPAARPQRDGDVHGRLGAEKVMSFGYPPGLGGISGSSDCANLSAVQKLWLLFIATLAFAADPFYLGTWKIDSAVLAPWADAQHKDDAAEMKTLVGKTVIFKPSEIVGPRQVACKTSAVPRQGLSGRHALSRSPSGRCRAATNRSTPLKLPPSWASRASHGRRLETGCDTELDFHYIDPTTTTFGLNNYIYILKKQ